MIKIERDTLASIVQLSEKSVRENLNRFETNKLLTELDKLRTMIDNYDRQQDVANFGKFKQQDLFK